jgi:hypothetical protein
MPRELNRTSLLLSLPPKLKNTKAQQGAPKAELKQKTTQAQSGTQTIYHAGLTKRFPCHRFLKRFPCHRFPFRNFFGFVHIACVPHDFNSRLKFSI